MQIARDEGLEEKFWTQLQDYMEKIDRTNEPNVYHVSDLLYPRKAYFKRKLGGGLTRENMGFFLAGKAHHFIAEQIIAAEGGELEKTVVLTAGKNTIVGTPDVTKAYPVEFKTSRKWTIPEEPPDHYVRQLEKYCVMMGTAVGVIIVFFITPGRTFAGNVSSVPDLRVWKVKFSKADLAAAKRELTDTADQLSLALMNDDFRGLALCEDWMCGGVDRSKKTYVSCPYYYDCKPEGRYPEKMLR